MPIHTLMNILNFLRRSKPITTYPQLLRAAAQILKRDGWMQGSYHQHLAPASVRTKGRNASPYQDRTIALADHHQGAHCVLGAMICALAEAEGREGACTEVELIKRFPAISTSSVSNRNDRVFRQTSDALGWLEAHAGAIEASNAPVMSIA